MISRFVCVAGLLATVAATAATRVVVTVVEPKSGQPVIGLKAQDFALFDDKKPLRVEDAEFSQATIDVMLLLDTSLMGQMVQPVAETLIAQLQPKEQMAVVAYHSSADLIQDFTSSRQMLSRAVSKVKYGNMPHVLDALYASIDGGFQTSSFRRMILLVTAGAEGNSRVNEHEVIKLARRNGVSIFPVYMKGYEKSLFDLLARQTGGAFFNLRDMKKSGEKNVGVEDFRSAARTLYADGQRQFVARRESQSGG